MKKNGHGLFVGLDDPIQQGENEMKTPTVYAAYSTERGRPDRPCIRKEDGQEVALITLSGYKVGAEMSPTEWRDRIVKAVNAHDDMVNAIQMAINYLSDDMDEVDDTQTRIMDALILAKSKAEDHK